MRILVTGACGFIGYHLAKELNELGHDVVAFVHKNSEREKKDFSMPVVVGDIRSREDLKSIGRVDCIHHLAANADPTDFCIEMVETNVIGTNNILELAKQHNSKVIFASSSAVYGNLPTPCSEDGDVHPLNAYGTTKIMSEYFCRAYMKEHDMDVVMLRYFNTYGIGEDIKGKDASMIFHFLQSAIKTNSVKIYGDGKQRRDFIYVKDAIKMNILAMEKKGISGESFNVGTGNSTTYNKLVDIIRATLGKDVKKDYVENPINKFYQFHTEA
ncbi:MAG: NAD-dependent epimerase/dehydratase family protein, partial [Nanoarchaeota archaeon]|nr:NAD-dependent epimerase/dehydratase family protein [Nanoarchaeota archaeon]